MASFPVPQHQSVHHHHHSPPQQPPSLSLQLLEEQEHHRHLDQSSPSTSVAGVIAPHLRHGHHHHTNYSGIGNLTFSLDHLDENNSHNFPLSLSSSMGPFNYSSPSNNFTFPFKNNGGNFTSVAAAAWNQSQTELISSSFPFNVSISDIEDTQSIYDNSSTTYITNTSILAVPDSPSQPPFVASLYAIIVPVMIFFCALTCIVNLVIVISARWCRRPMSPTLYYSISLALADAYASFILAVGLIINSLLPGVYNIKTTRCLSLAVEAFRSGGVLVTVCHLLALGINHWIGIARPLHYAATMTRRTAWIVILLSWSCPILMLFIYYSTISDQGFLSQGCVNIDFLKRSTYRIFFASCFFAPLFLLSLIYIHIFLIVRSHQTNRLRYQSSQVLRKNVKAALTTVLILGTYIIGWMPATLYAIIVCEDCIITLKDVTPRLRYAIGITVNVLVILKTFVDPIIYAARMSDIQLSLKKMKYDFLRLFCKACVHSLPPPDDRGFSKFNRSLYDTKSIRMSSFGSSSSSRRAGTAANANLINNSPGSQINGNGRFNNSFNYKKQNGNNTPNLLSTHCKSQLIQKKTSFEMTEMR